MPRLYRRQDGGYYTKSSVGDDRHTTLQIHRDGVQFLQQRGIVDGSEIGKRYMSQLWRKGWISTSGDNPVPRGMSSRTPSSTLIPSTSVYNNLVKKGQLPPSAEQISFWDKSENKPNYVEWEQQVLDEHFRAKYGGQPMRPDRSSSFQGTSEAVHHQPAPPSTIQAVLQPTQVDRPKSIYVLAGIGIGSVLWWLLERVF